MEEKKSQKAWNPSKASIYAKYYSEYRGSERVLRGQLTENITTLSFGMVSSRWIDHEIGEHMVPFDQITLRCKF